MIRFDESFRERTQTSGRPKMIRIISPGACAVWALAIYLSPGSLCYAQNAVSSGSLAGTIQDSSGAVLSGVAIAVIDESTGIRSTTKSNSRGIYVFPELAPGIYQVQFSFSQFKTMQIDGLKISVGQTANGDVTMQLGAVNESIVVAGSGTQNPTDPNPSSVVEKSTIDNIPSSGRRYTDFVLLTPNVTADGEFGHVSFAGQQGG